MPMVNNKKYDLIVIGGGPSGLIAAGRAAELGASVLLCEKNNTLGKKLLLTGGGRCNLTNAEYDKETFLGNLKEAKKYLYSTFAQFGVADTFEFFESRGLPLVTEARGRVFPQSQKSEDVLQVLIKYLKAGNVEILLNTPVIGINKDGNQITSVTTEQGEFTARSFVIATGGLSLPATGSTGDGFKFLKELGHTIIRPTPNLVPLVTNDQWVHALSGVAPSFVRLTFLQGGKAKIKKLGKVLFTHFGISGPMVLNSAAEVKKLLNNGAVTASIDLFPDTNTGELDRRLWRLFEKNKNKNLGNVLPEILEDKLAEAIIQLVEKDLSQELANLPINLTTKEIRAALVAKMQKLTFGIAGTKGMDWSIVSDGGVPLKEVDTKTMASRLYPNLFLLGDVLNINRPSGGYSLQLCWTTGYVAGTHAAEK